MLTRDSRIGEIYATPIGHDIIHTLLCRRAFRKRPSPTLWCAAFHCALCRSWRRAGWTTAWWIPCWAC